MQAPRGRASRPGSASGAGAYAAAVATTDDPTDEVVDLLQQLIRNACVNDGSVTSGHEVRSAIRVLTAHADGTPIVTSQERIRIDIFIRDNVP